MKTTGYGLSLLLAVAILGCGPQNQPAKGPMGGPMGGTPALPSVDDATKTLQKAGDDAAATVKKAGEDAAASAKATIDAATAKAQEALKGVEGGQEAFKSVTDFFTQVNETLGGIKDEATAKSAEPALQKLVADADAVKEGVGKLPAEAKTVIGGAVDQGISAIKALAEQLKKIPGVEPIVKPHLDALLAKVEGWKS